MVFPARSSGVTASGAAIAKERTFRSGFVRRMGVITPRATNDNEEGGIGSARETDRTLNRRRGTSNTIRLNETAGGLRLWGFPPRDRTLHRSLQGHRSLPFHSLTMRTRPSTTATPTSTARHHAMRHQNSPHQAGIPPDSNTGRRYPSRHRLRSLRSTRYQTPRSPPPDSLPPPPHGPAAAPAGSPSGPHRTPDTPPRATPPPDR
jgi:hypothetical protein